MTKKSNYKYKMMRPHKELNEIERAIRRFNDKIAFVISKQSIFEIYEKLMESILYLIPPIWYFEHIKFC